MEIKMAKATDILFNVWDPKDKEMLGPFDISDLICGHYPHGVLLHIDWNGPDGRLVTVRDGVEFFQVKTNNE